MTEPRTEAGKRLLAGALGGWPVMADAILAIEAEAASLDGLTVERLHNAIYQVWRKGHRDLRVGWRGKAWDGTLAAAIFAALRDEGETA